VTNEVTLAGNFSNEGASGGNIRLLKNINALWLLQQCRRSWSPEGSLTYDEIREMAESAPALTAFVDPDHAGFANPDDMPSAICAFCQTTGQRVPATRAEIARVVMESIALKYRSVVDRLRVLHGKPINKVHVMGGGARNGLLNQFAADAIGLPVHAGPLEATAIGNLLLQAKALGHLESDDQIREVVRNSFEVKTYEPLGSAEWEEAYRRFQEIEGK
jgi:rhamnulokinase